jgi:DNA relaxase NicK
MVSIRCHWLAFTVHADILDTVDIVYNGRLEEVFGKLEYVERGFNSYQRSAIGRNGVRILYDPKQLDKRGLDHCHVILPGGALDCLQPSDITDLCNFLLKSGMQVNVTRVDLAVDNCPFSVDDVYNWMVENEGMNTYAKRESIQKIYNPFEENELGGLGCNTVYLGASSSSRRLCCYDRRGYTRLELRWKEEIANIIAFDVLCRSYSEWFQSAISHIRQYVDFSNNVWVEFCQGVQKASIVIQNSVRGSVEKTEKWLTQQVLPSLVALSEIYKIYTGRPGVEYLNLLAKKSDARQRSMRGRYGSIIQNLRAVLET